MSLSEASVRPAVPQDAHAIAGVHVESSQAAYVGIFPKSWLARLTVDERTRAWHDRLSQPEPRWTALVGCDGRGNVVGFASGGVERTGGLGCDGELYAIYLLPRTQRQGLGKQLVRRLAAELQSLGFMSMAVWVLTRNSSAKFYQALGGEEIARRQIERDGEWFEEIAYAWKDLRAARFE